MGKERRQEPFLVVGAGLGSERGETKQKTLMQTQIFLLSPHDIILGGWQDFTVQAVGSGLCTGHQQCPLLLSGWILSA